MASGIRSIHVLSSFSHTVWDSSIKPAARVAPGDTLTLQINNASGGQIDAQSTATVLDTLDFSLLNPVTGPVEVLGAAPGDTLVVDIVAIEFEEWGWTANIPGFGLLSDDFPEPALRISKVSETTVEFPGGLLVPRNAMIGTIGLPPKAPGPHSIIPPHPQGGNMDVRLVGPGSRLRIPVAVPGALLSLGDTHAAQGDGEVCGTGVETASLVTVRVDIEKGRSLASPWLEVTIERNRQGRALVTTGIGPDLFQAAKDATRALIEEVVHRTGISPIEAYMLASVAGDLSIAEIVDRPNWVVLLQLPLSVLGGK